MQYYLAPMEEITSFVFRNAVAEMFGAPDRCFAPFIAPTQKMLVKKRERKDVSAENNRGITLIPQILTRNAKGFCDVAEYLLAEGYREVNLNLGCPSGTVTAKGKGSGFLKTPALLDVFLGDIFASLEGTVDISVKTRIGYESEEEFPLIWEILNRYPFSEIILHPRLRCDFYKGSCRLDAVAYVLAHRGDAGIVYNGDICFPSDEERLRKQFPEVSCLMIGRGMVRNPGLIRQLRTGEVLKKDELREFCTKLYQGYATLYQDEHNAMHKMKELWTYMVDCFADAARPTKRLLKARTPEEYLAAEDRIFACAFAPEGKSPRFCKDNGECADI